MHNMNEQASKRHKSASKCAVLETNSRIDKMMARLGTPKEKYFYRSDSLLFNHLFPKEPFRNSRKGSFVQVPASNEKNSKKQPFFFLKKNISAISRHSFPPCFGRPVSKSLSFQKEFGHGPLRFQNSSVDLEALGKTKKNDSFFGFSS